MPAALTTTSELVTVDGVDWFAERLSAGYAFTTVGRTTNVEVNVPNVYRPEASVLPTFSSAIRAADPPVAG